MRGVVPLMVAAILLAGCGDAQEEAVGGVSAEEAAALNNAAEMLDASPDSLAAPQEEVILEGGNTGEAVANASQ